MSIGQGVVCCDMYTASQCDIYIEVHSEHSESRGIFDTNEKCKEEVIDWNTSGQ